MARVELVDQITRKHLNQMQAHVWITLAHARNQRQAKDRCCCGRQANAGIAAHAPALRGQHSVLGLTQCQPGMVLERQPGRGRRHAGAGAGQQPRAQLTFELGQLLAQRRSANPQLKGGAAEAAVFKYTEVVA